MIRDFLRRAKPFVPGRLSHQPFAIDLDTTSQFDGPIDGSTVMLGQSTSSSFPGLSFVPAGMPGNPEVYAQPQAPQLYAG